VEYRQLGPSGCLVSSFALGTMTFGSETDERASHWQLDFFTESGGNLIDLADVYWLADRPPVASVIIGARSADQLKDNLGAAGLRLSAGEIAQLDKVSDPGAVDYPYGSAGTQQRSRTVSSAGA
jgi:aryl-alcohol dehydrogenase-like predicted oxidoreductase